jgi:hypothetical protein
LTPTLVLSLRVPLRITEGSMAEPFVRNPASAGDIFAPGQIFTFGSITFHADLTGRLNPVETSPLIAKPATGT